MIRNILCAAIASIPLTAITDYSKYLLQDWEFAKWIVVLIVIDTILGIIKGVIHKDASSEDFWKGFSKKMIVYLVLMILSNVLANYTIDGHAVGATEWMSEYLCIFMITREAISILENTNAIYPILPTKMIQRFKDFSDDGIYINKKHRKNEGKRRVD